jgi:hypothetical protein
MQQGCIMNENVSDATAADDYLCSQREKHVACADRNQRRCGVWEWRCGAASAMRLLRRGSRLPPTAGVLKSLIGAAWSWGGRNTAPSMAFA